MADRAAQHEWITPQLVVLVRGRPEESVLWACKDLHRDGANHQYAGCLASIDVDCNNVCNATQGT